MCDGPTTAPDDSAAFFERYAELAGHMNLAVGWAALPSSRPGDARFNAKRCQLYWTAVVDDCAQLAAVADRLACAAVAAGQGGSPGRPGRSPCRLPDAASLG
ncbi:MAG: hypothetical protein ACRDRR_08525 [Pseudonocardiaceae bacterium]